MGSLERDPVRLALLAAPLDDLDAQVLLGELGRDVTIIQSDAGGRSLGLPAEQIVMARTHDGVSMWFMRARWIEPRRLALDAKEAKAVSAAAMRAWRMAAFQWREVELGAARVRFSRISPSDGASGGALMMIAEATAPGPADRRVLATMRQSDAAVFVQELARHARKRKDA